MEALRFSFRNKTLELERIEKPQIIEPDDILIKIAYAGVCGTDLHILGGEFPCKEASDITLGHEISGIIVEVGHDVINFQEGDKVVVDPNRGCKRCSFCHGGKPHFCKIGCATNIIGIYRDGGWAQYIVVPEEQVFKLPTTVTMEQAVLAEPISCIIHGWDLLSPVAIGEKILIQGAGICGTLWACALHLQGHRRVIISEPNPLRSDMFRRLNTGYLVVTPDNLRKNAEADPEKWCFDDVIDCSGYGPAIEQGLRLLNSGGKYCQWGVTEYKTKVQIFPFDLFWKELKIFGVKTNPYTFTKAVNFIEALGSRYLNYNNLSVKVYPLNQYKEALDTVKKGKILKAVFKMA